MKYKFLVLAVFFLPLISHAEVIFSEIAWMGTEADANDEWIEIYNFSSAPANLEGWTLTDGNSLNISLSGTMSPHGVFVFERTDDSTLPSIPADIIYTGALSNSGATLTIKDASGTVINEVVGGSDWENIGGSNEHKMTAQRTRTGEWITAEPTPGAPNAEEDELPEPKETKNSSGVSLSSAAKTVPARREVTEERERYVNDGLQLTVNAPETVYVNQEISFGVGVSGVGKATESSLKYFWNFGDLTTSEKKSPRHVFSTEGNYVVAVEAKYKSQETQARHTIKVLPVSLRVVPVPGGGVMIINESSQEILLDGFSLKGTKQFKFPRLSILVSGGTITVPQEKIGNTNSSVVLKDVKGVVVSTTKPTPQVLGVTQTAPVYSYSQQTSSTVSTKEEEQTFGKESAEERNSNIITIGNSPEKSGSGFWGGLLTKIGGFFRL